MHRSAVRLVRTPRWTLPIVLTLAIAIGATAAIFAVMDAVFLRSYPYHDPGRLVVLHDEYRGLGRTRLGLSGPELFDYSERTKEFAGLGAYTTGRVTVQFGTPRQVSAAWLSDNLLQVVGVQPATGRGFTSSESRPGGQPVALVSQRFWRQHLASRNDPRQPRTVRIGEELVQVVGVLPEDFRLPSDLSRSSHSDLYFPLGLNPAEPGHRQNPVLNVVGRLAPRATIERARHEQEQIAAAFQAAYPGDYPARAGFAMTMLPLSQEVVGDVRGSLLIVCGAVSLLFLVSLTNASGLILARLDDRRQELGIRVALGARFVQLFREFIEEGFVLAATAAVLGSVGAYALGRFLLDAHSDTIPRLSEAAVSDWVLLFVAVSTSSIVLVFATASTVRIARSDWARAVLSRERPAGAKGRPGSWRRTLASGQIALTVALTAGAGFLISNYREVQAVNLGFTVHDALIVDLLLPSQRYREASRVTSFFDSLLEDLRGVPGVRSAALVAFLPLDSPSEVWPVELQDRPLPDHGASAGADAQIVSEDYFRTLGIPVLRGRDFRTTDRVGAPVVVVNATFARTFFSGENPLGRNLRPRLSADAPWASIVGVVADVPQGSVMETPRPQVYFLHNQIPLFAGVPVRSMQVVVQASAEPEDLIRSVRGVIWALDGELALGPVRTLRDVVARATFRFRFPTQLLGIFALTALAVSLAGVYGVISQVVAGSIRDLGIRMALGATPSGIFSLVIREGMVLVVAGVLPGLFLAAGLTRLFADLFVRTGGRGGIYLAVGAAVTAAGFAACFLPAKRAANLDPNRAIRDDAR